MSGVSNQFRGVTVRVEGLSQANRALTKAGADSQDMKLLMFSIGTLIIRAADVPVVSGKLLASLKAGKGKTKAVVKAGGIRTPYGPVVHYGWDSRGIEPNPFLLNALKKERLQVGNMISNGIKDILRKNELN